MKPQRELWKAGNIPKHKMSFKGFRKTIDYFDCFVVKDRQDGRACNKAVYLMLGITMEYRKKLLKLLISQNERAKFWIGVMTELKNCCVHDILMVAVDGQIGFLDAINAIAADCDAAVHRAHDPLPDQIRVVERSQRVM